MSDNIISITVRIDGTGPLVKMRGRNAWALAELLKAGAAGLISLERPAPRWSQYILKNRRAGIDIETLREPHAGAYAGYHARYVLRSPIEVIAQEVSHG